MKERGGNGVIPVQFGPQTVVPSPTSLDSTLPSHLGGSLSQEKTHTDITQEDPAGSPSSLANTQILAKHGL